MWFLVPARLRPLAFLASLALVALGTVWMWSLGLSTAEASQGSVALELAGDTARSSEVINSWRQKFGSLDPAFKSIAIDYLLYIPSYSTALGLLCLWAGRSMEMSRHKASTDGPGLGTSTGSIQSLADVAARFGVSLAWAQTAAGLFDCAENAGILVMLRGPAEAPWPQITTGSARVKFVLITGGLLYGALGGIAWVMSRAAGRER